MQLLCSLQSVLDQTQKKKPRLLLFVRLRDFFVFIAQQEMEIKGVRALHTSWCIRFKKILCIILIA